VRYEETHPWITFRFSLDGLSKRTWFLLGEATSKCQHVAGTALKPAISQMLNSVYLTKGAHGTTSIEGNTLSEEEVRKVVEGELALPPSQEYRQKEIQNFIDAANLIVGKVERAEPLDLTVEWLSELNAILLDDLPLRDEVKPGVIRDHDVGVRLYKGPHHVEVEHLLNRLCTWLEGPDFETDGSPDLQFTRAFSRACLSHLYLAWIHPFGDGNGRLARLIEFQMLLEGGVPLPSAHLLSDFYNLTRDKYYIELDHTEVPPYGVEPFFDYALEGFVDELRQQIGQIREQQLDVTWENYVHDRFRGEDTPAKVRQRHLVMDLPVDEWTSRRDIPGLTPRLAAAYAGKGSKTITRDLNALAKKGLIVRDGARIRPRREQVLAFLPLRNSE
jgi:Fic family protein